MTIDEKKFLNKNKNSYMLSEKWLDPGTDQQFFSGTRIQGAKSTGTRIRIRSTLSL
jgi:hypothetical protein